MKTHLWKNTFVILMATLLVTAQTLWAADKLAPGGAQAGKGISREQGGLIRYGQEVLSGLAGDIQIPKATIQSFSVLFERNKPELERLANTHQELIWGALEVVIEVQGSPRRQGAYPSKYVRQGHESDGEM
jgi:hypothetical protein